MQGITVRGDDGVVGFGEVEGEQAGANATVGAGDEDGCWCHLCLVKMVMDDGGKVFCG